MRTRILVVEDESTISEPLAESLEREQFEAEVAATLVGAREAIHRELPDLVLLDVMLPDGDGRDLAREIRRASDVPIVMLTAKVRRSTASSGSSWARTTMSLSPSHRESSRPGSEPSCAEAARGGSGARSRSGRSASTPPLGPSRRTEPRSSSRPEVRPRPLAHGARGRGPPRERIMDEVGTRTGSGRRRRSTCHLLAPQEDRGRPFASVVHHDDPGVGFRFQQAEGR